MSDYDTWVAIVLQKVGAGEDAGLGWTARERDSPDFKLYAQRSSNCIEEKRTSE